MTRILFLIVLLTGVIELNAQQFWQIDKRSAGIEATMPDELARKLTAPYKTDIEKFRAIFSWITSHIEYKLPPRSYAKTNQQLKRKMDTTWESRSLDERVAYNVMKNRTAVCEGYSRLLKTLCDFAGLSCNVINGFAKTGDKTDKIFSTNHTWNAVYIDTAWQLVDVTWASGGISMMTGEFVKKYDDFYFLTPPKDFIVNHYPEDPKWALLERSPVMREYDHAPFRLKAYSINRFTTYSPAKGLIEASPGDTIRIHLTQGEIANSNYKPGLDFAAFSFSPLAGEAYIQPLYENAKKEVLYDYIVTAGVEWVNVVYKDDVVIRYRVKAKKT